MFTKTALGNQGKGFIKLLSLLVALLLIFTACENGVMNTSDNRSDSITTDMLTGALKKGPANCENQVNNTEKKLLDCVTLDGVRAHQAAFQEIADANGGSRAAYTLGYDQSTDYVEAVMSEAGYSVERLTFSIQSYVVNSSAFQQISPSSIDYTLGDDYTVFSYSASGDVTASSEAIPTTTGFGCNPTDFSGFTGGNIAIVSRGACSFQLKAELAEAAGATAIVIYNDGIDPNRLDPVSGTLSESYSGNIPAISVSNALGLQFESTTPELRIQVDGGIATLNADNLIAELPGKNTDNIVMAGAVLDSPGATPGINNNGSGAAAVLETAVQMAKVKPQNTVRFAWWADNSTNVLGSLSYLQGLTVDELGEIATYLNFDVIGSPNYVTFVYDGDNSDGVNNPAAPPEPSGTDVIEDVFEEYFSGVGEPMKAFDLWFRSASQEFLISGVPSGGIYTGTATIKTPDEAATWGGVDGEPYDPCAFLACDTFDNVSLEALERNSDAVAYSILNFAMNTNLINGEKAKGNFKRNSDEISE